MEEVKQPQGRNFAIVNLSVDDNAPALPKMQINKSSKWITYGAKNLFPQEIIEINSKSPVTTSIIESTVTYICGKGVKDSNADSSGVTGAPNTGESWDNLIEKIAKDYKTFGGFYWQVIVNKDSTTVSLFHQDFSTVRIGEIDETGKPKTFKIANDWTKTSGKGKPIELPVWPGMIEAKAGTPYMFYYWDYIPGLLFYSIPNYYAAIEYIKADGRLGTFYNNSIKNGFTPSVTISVPANPTEKEKEQFQREVQRVFSGENNACKALIVWGETDNVRTKVDAFSASNNADLYNNVEGIIFQKIISANRLSSPTLAGVSGSGNLSGNAAEIIDAYVLYNYTVIEKMRRVIIDNLNIFTNINGTKKLVISDLDVLPKIRETEPGETITNEPATLSKKGNKLTRYLKSLAKK